MAEPGCTRPAGGPVEEVQEQKSRQSQDNNKAEGRKMLMVGQKVPDFTAPAYHNGQFTNVTLSEYKGKWVILCFYPGDFTFV